MAIEYKSLEIALREIGPTECMAEVISSPYGRGGTSTFKQPYTEEALDSLIDELGRRVRNSAHDRRDLVHIDPGADKNSLLVEPCRLGKTMFEHLCSGSIKEAYDRSVGIAEGRKGSGADVGLRLRIAFDWRVQNGRLATLPWELLWQDEKYLVTQRHAPIVRCLSQNRVDEPIEVSGRVRVLIVDAAPVNLITLDSRRERQAIEEALLADPRFEVDYLKRPDPGCLRERLLDGAYTVLHFIGHGGRPDGGDGSLFFEDERQRALEVEGRVIDEILTGFSSLKLIILNSCWSAAAGKPGSAGRGASIAMRLARHYPAVLAMQFPISDQAAITFSSTFYKRLAKDDPIDAAVSEARLRIHIEDSHGLEWMTPVLYLNSKGPRGNNFTFSRPDLG